jgi:GDP-4-dehydro-6-deoxy-D-mannose reductase
MRALITGIVGFAGSYLAAELLDAGYEVCGTQLPGENRERLRGMLKHISISKLDLRDSSATGRLIRRIRPDMVFHLAAISAVGYSFDNPRETVDVNVAGTVNLLEALRELESAESIVTITSSDIYGVVKPSQLPIKETALIEPVSPYAISKAAADMFAYQYYKSYGLPIVRARFVVPDFCAQIAAIECGSMKPEIRVGNLEAERDISDVRDIVRGYRLLAENGKPGEAYNLCSGKAHRIKWILERLLDTSTVSIRVRRDRKKMRPSEVPRLVGSYSKAKRHAGYRPNCMFENTLENTLEYWRTVVRRR